MAVVTAAEMSHDEFRDGTQPLADELVPAFLEQLERAGVKASAKAIGVNEMAAYKRRWSDAAFREAWATARAHRHRMASDEFFLAIDAMSALLGSPEHALDELINIGFAPDRAEIRAQMDRHAVREGIDQALLAGARERLVAGAIEWARCVIKHPDANGCAA